MTISATTHDALDLRIASTSSNGRDPLREERSPDEEDRGVRKREPLGEPHPDEGREHHRRDDEDGRSEIADLVHGRRNLRRPAAQGACLQPPYTVLMLDTRPSIDTSLGVMRKLTSLPALLTAAAALAASTGAADPADGRALGRARTGRRDARAAGAPSSAASAAGRCA